MLMVTATHFLPDPEPAMAKAPRDDDFKPDLPRRRRYVHEDDEPQRTDEDQFDRRPREDDEFVDDYDVPPPRMKKNRKQRIGADKLRALAVRQMLVLLCIVLYVGVLIGRIFLPDEWLWLSLLVPAVVTVLSALFGTRLAMAAFGTGLGIFLGFLTLIPIIGLIVLVVVNVKATGIMQQNGVRVGLLGARMSDID